MTRGSFILTVLCAPALLFSADGPDESESLRDLDGVRVVVEDLSASAKSNGLAKDGLQQLVESKLRAAGVPISHSGDFPVGDPHLRVRVAASEQSSGMIGYDVEIGFYQIVFIRRNPSVTFNRGRTWKSEGHVGLVPSARLADSVKQELSGQMDQFIQAYFKVNAK